MWIEYCATFCCLILMVASSECVAETCEWPGQGLRERLCDLERMYVQLGMWTLTRVLCCFAQNSGREPWVMSQILWELKIFSSQQPPCKSPFSQYRGSATMLNYWLFALGILQSTIGRTSKFMPMVISHELLMSLFYLALLCTFSYLITFVSLGDEM